MAENLTQAQRTVLETLYDVSTHEGGAKTLKNRYHSAAMALIRHGFVVKHQRDFYRPRYEITEAGKAFWRECAPESAAESDR
jgi:DNA-binding MarR family transcriptional regulator